MAVGGRCRGGASGVTHLCGAQTLPVPPWSASEGSERLMSVDFPPSLFGVSKIIWGSDSQRRSVEREPSLWYVYICACIIFRKSFVCVCVCVCVCVYVCVQGCAHVHQCVRRNVCVCVQVCA